MRSTIIALGALLPLWISCMAVSPTPPRLTLIETIPAGATCITDAGEVYVTPASIPCPQGGVLRIQVALAGHERKLVAVHTRQRSPQLETLLVGGILRFMSGEVWEHVEAQGGRTVLVLEPQTGWCTPGSQPAPGPQPALGPR